jgi:methyltransferase family protein
MFTLDRVVPWGRSFDEYRHMFALSEHDLQTRILGCADGPAGFNAEASRRGAAVVSCDPLYGAHTRQIRQRIEATFDEMLDQTRRNADEFVWDTITSVDELAVLRTSAMETFLADYDEGRIAGRYVEGELPALPFPDQSFDLALCSHFLFLYSDQLGEAFHLDAVHELRRVAREVRIFPLLALGCRPSPYVDTIVASVRISRGDVSIEAVPYEFVRGGNQMMRIRG